MKEGLEKEIKIFLKKEGFEKEIKILWKGEACKKVLGRKYRFFKKKKLERSK